MPHSNPWVPLRYLKSKIVMVEQISRAYYLGMDKRGPIYVPCYGPSFIEYLGERFRYHVKDGYDVVIMVTGKRRRGKSNVINATHLAVDPDFSVGNIAFTLEEFFEKFASNPYADPEKGVYPQVAADESGFAMNARNWMESTQRHLEQKIEIGGIKRQICSLTLPHRKKLDSAIREDMAAYTIHVTLFEGVRGMAIFREGIENEFEQQMYWPPLCVFKFLPLETTHPDWWAKYQERKVGFVNDTLGTGKVEETARIRQLTDQRNRAMRELYKVTHESHRDIARRVDMPLSTVDKILNAR